MRCFDFLSTYKLVNFGDSGKPLTHSPKVDGSNPAPCNGRGRSSLFPYLDQFLLRDRLVIPYVNKKCRHSGAD